MIGIRRIEDKGLENKRIVETDVSKLLITPQSYDKIVYSSLVIKIAKISRESRVSYSLEFHVYYNNDLQSLL